MRYFCVKNREFRTVDLGSFLPLGEFNATKIYLPNSRVSRRYTIDPREWWKQMNDHMDRISIQNAYANHWAFAEQTPLVLVMDRSPLEVSSSVEGSLTRTDTSAELLTICVVFVEGPLDKTATEQGMRFMVMAGHGIIAGF